MRLNGFSSGTPTSAGAFSYQFNQAGWYYYWSGFVESSGQISFRGVIFVQDTIDVEYEVNVILNGYQG